MHLHCQRVGRALLKQLLLLGKQLLLMVNKLLLLLLHNMRRWNLRLDGWLRRCGLRLDGCGSRIRDILDVVVRSVSLLLDVVVSLVIDACAEVLGYVLLGHLPCNLEVRVLVPRVAHQGEHLGGLGSSFSHTCSDLATASADHLSLPWQEACIIALCQFKGPCI